MDAPGNPGVLTEFLQKSEERTGDGTRAFTTYPVREGIGIFLTPDLPRNDYWEASQSGLLGFLKDHPEIERGLMGSPVESLNPTDQFYRSQVLDLTGRYAEARTLERAARAPIRARLWTWPAAGESWPWNCWSGSQIRLS